MEIPQSVKKTVLPERGLANVKRLLPVLGLMAAVSAGVMIYFAPHRAFARLERAVESGDKAEVAKLVDRQALREDIESQFDTARLQTHVQSMKTLFNTSTGWNESEPNPFAAMLDSTSALLVPSLVDTTMEVITSPEGLERIMAMDYLSDEDDLAKDISQAKQPIRDRYYVNARLFVLKLIDEESGKYIEMRMARTGLIRWHLAGIRGS
jgi:hypothetical protein